MASNLINVSSQINWKKCCLCQTDKNEALQSPPTHYLCEPEKDGYAMLAKNIPLFEAINQLPIRLNTSRLNEGSGIEMTLRNNNAKYHRTCRLLFNNYKLERANKRSSTIQSDPGEGPSKMRRTSLEVKKCFLCEKLEPVAELRQAMTMQLNERINECAKNLNDGKLLAILSGGDVVALELKYHCSCLTSLYNKEKSHLLATEKLNKDVESPESVARPLVFSELVAYVNETRKNSDKPVIFRLSELVSLYTQRLQHFVSNISDVNRTKLKERLLKEIPELEAHRKGREVLLGFKQDIGPILAEASNYSDAIIMNKAAEILRREMVDHKSKFEGIIDDKSILDSIPATLLHFVCMIEHGTDIKSQLRFWRKHDKPGNGSASSV